jgi:hypothetical protein
MEFHEVQELEHKEDIRTSSYIDSKFVETLLFLNQNDGRFKFYIKMKCEAMKLNTSMKKCKFSPLKYHLNKARLHKL